jgi:nucleoside diphosphate kinase
VSIEEVPASLSRDAGKRARYAEDTYFQEGWGHLEELCGDPAGFAYRHGLVLLKPDAVVTRRLLPALDWLADSGFRVVAARPVLMHPTRARALWYFQWNAATSYRRRLADLCLTPVESMLLVVRAEGERVLPASVLVTDGKGPTEPAEREPGQLRHLLGRFSYLLNLLHTTDEPADVARELAVYFDSGDRARVIAEAAEGADRSGAARELATRLYAESTEQDLEFEPAARRLLARAGRLAGDRGVAAAARADLTDALGRDGHDALRGVLEAVWRHELDLPSWDVVVTGASVLPMKNRAHTNLVGTVTAADWDPVPSEVDLTTPH